MSLECPKCGASIGAMRAKGDFDCPSCGVALEGKVGGPIIAAIILSTIADALIIYPGVYAVWGDDWWPGLTLRIVFSTLVFFSLIALFVGNYGRLQSRNNLPPDE